MTHPLQEACYEGQSRCVRLPRWFPSGLSCSGSRFDPRRPLLPRHHAGSGFTCSPIKTPLICRPPHVPSQQLPGLIRPLQTLQTTVVATVTK